MIELLASKLGRNDEIPNIELAELLCNNEDRKGIKEIVYGLNGKDKAVASDCIKVLYEIGQRKPELIAEFSDSFITGLSSKNNRIVWGSMRALSTIVSIVPEKIFNRLPEVIDAYKKGSVITIDNSISVFAGLCSTNQVYCEQISPLLLEHLTNCRAGSIPQHLERIIVHINSSNKVDFNNLVIGIRDILEIRQNELSASQRRKVSKLIKMI